MHMHVVVTTSGYSEPDMHNKSYITCHSDVYTAPRAVCSTPHSKPNGCNKVDVHTCTSVTESLSDP